MKLTTSLCLCVSVVNDLTKLETEECKKNNWRVGLEQNPFFVDYYWEHGSPFGWEPVEDFTSRETTYKIIRDCYGKHISIERFTHGVFAGVVYDSNFLDFRKLTERDQLAWEKVSLEEGEGFAKILIRDGEDRAKVLETYRLEKALCVECSMHSPHGFFIGCQKLYYEALGNSHNGMTLFDSAQHPVMHKRYKADEMGVFTELIEELWEMKDVSLPE